MAGDSDPKTDKDATTDTVGASVDTLAAPAPGPTPRLSLSDYEIGKPLGRGGMGEVLLAKDPSIGREVAIKRMVGAMDEVAVARFVREAKIQAQLEHPAIVPVHQIGYDANSQPFFTMKRLVGTTLQDVLRDPSTKLQRLLRALVDVCNAIELAHTRGVVHRDLKPANIMLGDFGEVYVLDWGIARVVGGFEGHTSPGLPLSGETQAGAMMGTLGYMAPEQLTDASTAGPAADIYALGCILFEILAGEPVHPRGAEAMTTTLTEDSHSPAARAPGRAIPPELDLICTATLAYEPAKRPTARALRDRIQNYLDGDRDLEHRRALAVEHLGKATEAMRDPLHRAEATHEAGRALALDPTSRDAADLVNTLTFETPEVLPPDLVAQLEELDQTSSRFAAGSASRMMFGFFIVIPLALWSGIASWPWLIGLSLTIGVMCVVSYRESRARRTNEYMALIGMTALCVVFTRFAGVFIFMPAILTLALMGLGQQATFIKHPILLMGAALMAFAAPLLLEAVGIFQPTFSIDHGRIMVASEAVQLEGTPALIFLLVPNVIAGLLAGLFGRALGVTRRNAMIDLEIRAWHMRRLIGLTEPAPT